MTANELVGKARDGKLKIDDTRGGTFTISNVGTFGSLMGTPIINQPEAAILATGIIKKRAEVIEKPEGDVIPPFLIGEMAGSLAIEYDRIRLREFAVAVLDCLERTESTEDNVVRNVPFGCSNSD